LMDYTVMLTGMSVLHRHVRMVEFAQMV